MRVLLIAVLLLATPATAREISGASGGSTSVMAQVERLNTDLLSRDSATATLQLWCDSHGPGGGAKIVARRIRGADKAAGKAERRALGVFAQTRVAYRRVELLCGDKVLSEADNWYVPGRLTAAMNTALEQTQTPFGVVVRPLKFHRRTLSSEVLLGDGTMTQPGAVIIPPEVLRHRAVLSTPNGRPFSLVVETYTDQVLVSPP
ncbi:hypothetical protein JKL49_19110 [Phenylobacterium sp. 20VBR1]|uniref:Uncharacterized protein n=1 Tax=Phenylobacterium glaciei TaxID=2803784 RepID=A0A941D531_9CAUL|nr:hypothetical protein [Phenylobacterium glaciei]MBR7621509.1 hypothetical protein [Phenylobacterium glaciei]